MTPFEYCKYISKILKDFFKNNRNIKFSLVLVCSMERRIIRGGVVGLLEDKTYFHSGTHISLLSTDVKKLLVKNIKNILKKLEEFEKMVVDGILKK